MEDKSKNYKVLQTIAKIGKILSKVAFVFSIIGICGCFVGLLSNVFGSGKFFKIGGVTIYGLLAEVVQGILTGFMNVSVDGWMEEVHESTSN